MDKDNVHSLDKARKQRKETRSERNKRILDKSKPLPPDQEKKKRELLEKVLGRLEKLNMLVDMLHKQQYRRANPKIDPKTGEIIKDE